MPSLTVIVPGAAEDAGGLCTCAAAASGVDVTWEVAAVSGVDPVSGAKAASGVGVPWRGDTATGERESCSKIPTESLFAFENRVNLKTAIILTISTIPKMTIFRLLFICQSSFC
jgi:hypothetical protein